MPIQRRLPKFGFKSLDKVVFKPINLDTLETLATSANLTKIGSDELRQHGFLGKTDKVKVLANGALTLKLDVEANAFSKTAEAAIIAAGGTVVKL